jgi:hypothetical protein
MAGVGPQGAGDVKRRRPQCEAGGGIRLRQATAIVMLALFAAWAMSAATVSGCET